MLLYLFVFVKFEIEGSCCLFFNSIFMNMNLQEMFLECLSSICFHTCESKKGGKDQELIQSSSTHDPGFHMGK